MSRHSSLSDVASSGSWQTYTLENEETDTSHSSISHKQDIKKSSGSPTSPTKRKNEDPPKYKLGNPSSSTFFEDIDTPEYKPPPAPPPFSSTSGYSSGRTSTAATIAHRYYSAQRPSRQVGLNSSLKASPDDSNANLQRYSSLGFGVNPEDWEKRDKELFNTFNASNNNSMIAYPAKIVRSPNKSQNVVKAEAERSQAAKTPPHSTKPSPPAAAPSKPPKAPPPTAAEQPKPSKTSPSPAKESPKSKPKSPPAKENSKPKSPPAKENSKPKSPPAKESSKPTPPPKAESSKAKKESPTQPAEAPSKPKSPPAKEKPVSKSPPSTAKKTKSPPSTQATSKSPPADKVAFDKSVDEMAHLGHVDSKQKRNIVRRQTGFHRAKEALLEIDEEEEDEDANEEDDYVTDEEPPPAPPEYADVEPKRESVSSHKSTGPTIEDDRTAGKRKKPSPPPVIQDTSSDKEEYEERKLSGGSGSRKASVSSSHKSKASTVVPKPSPPPPPPKPIVEPKSSEGSSGSGGTFVPRTPPRTQENSSESLPPPPLTPSEEPKAPEPEPTPPHDPQQGHNLTLPICNCNDAKLVQAKLIECFETQPRSQCHCQSQCEGGRAQSNRGGGGKCCCCSCKPSPPPTCFTPCNCQRCRVYHYCFNVLNRHTLKPEDMFLGISQFENYAQNTLHRQHQNIPPPNCPTSHIITNKEEPDGNMENGGRRHSGAKNWASPPEGYQDVSKQVLDGGTQEAQQRLFGSHCTEASGMINPWQTEYTAQFKDFSDQIRRSSSRYPSYDEGYAGRFGGSCCGGGGGRQGRQKNCFDDARSRNCGFGGGSYVQIPEEARRIHLLSKLHSCNNNNLDFKCNYIPSNQFCSWMKLRMAVRATRCCEMKKLTGCCRKPDGGCGCCMFVGGKRKLRSGSREGSGRGNSKGRSKSGGRKGGDGCGYDDGYNTKQDFVGGRDEMRGRKGGCKASGCGGVAEVGTISDGQAGGNKKKGKDGYMASGYPTKEDSNNNNGFGGSTCCDLNNNEDVPSFRLVARGGIDNRSIFDDLYGGAPLLTNADGDENTVFKAALDEPYEGLRPLEKVPRQTLDLPPRKEGEITRDPEELFRYYKSKADEWRETNPEEEEKEASPSGKSSKKKMKKGGTKSQKALEEVEEDEEE